MKNPKIPDGDLREFPDLLAAKNPRKKASKESRKSDCAPGSLFPKKILHSSLLLHSSPATKCCFVNWYKSRAVG